MEYALVNGIRTPAQKGLSGICIGCGAAMSARCGDLSIHHWAHKKKIDCDLWWENETLWHRNWKARFPEEFREINMYNDDKSEYHRADIHNKNGVTIEFQNSPLSLVELQKREVFYEKLIWILNGDKLKGFQISYGIFDPEDPLLNNYIIKGGLILKFTIADHRFWPKRMRPDFTMDDDIFNDIKKSDVHDTFQWKHAHRTWLNATKPIFIDIGGPNLYRLKRKKQITEDFLYLKRIKKTDFLMKYGGLGT